MKTFIWFHFCILRAKHLCLRGGNKIVQIQSENTFIEREKIFRDWKHLRTCCGNKQRRDRGVKEGLSDTLNIQEDYLQAMTREKENTLAGHLNYVKEYA